MPGTTRQEMLSWLDATLQPDKFKDYAPNGLQVQGRAQIRKVITGVTASKALVDAAITHNADAILVHHGWFWGNESRTICGNRHARIKALLAADINLFAYHLPLDAHPVLGNNAQLAKLMGWQPQRHSDGSPVLCGPHDLVWLGQPSAPCTLAQLGQQLEHSLGRPSLVLGDATQSIQRLAWCTGGAQDFVQAAIDASVDCYITGEVSEPNLHLAQESGCSFISAGHHATERYGVQALGQALAQHFGIECSFVDLYNPA